MGQGSKVTMGKAFAKNGRSLDDDALSAVTREFVRYYEADPVSHTTAFDGVAEVVARFARLGLKQGVCTNKFERPVAHDPGAPEADAADRRRGRRRHLPRPQARSRHILMLVERMGGNARAHRHDRQFDPRCRGRPRAPAFPAVLVSWGYTAQARQRARRRRRDRPFRRPARDPGTTRHPLTIRPGASYTRPFRALSSAGEHTLHTGGVVGSIPTAPTIIPDIGATFGTNGR